MHPRPAPVEKRRHDAEDVAKRLMDYGFHAPTLSWPVAGTLMVEPTESESKYELDRFCDAMISIHAEMKPPWKTGSAKQFAQERAAHRATDRQRQLESSLHARSGGVPRPRTHDYKFWPHVGRVDNVYGDRNLVCSCPPVEEFDSIGTGDDRRAD